MKRILVCSPSVPADDRGAAARRIFHTIACLRDAGYAVTFFTLNGTDGEQYVHLLQEMGVPVYMGSHTIGAGDSYVSGPEELITYGRFDLAIIAFWDLAEYLLPILRSLSPRTVVIVDSIALHLLHQARRTFLPSGTSVLDDEYASAAVRELNAYAAADYILATSANEVAIIGEFLGTSDRVICIPVMGDIAHAVRPFAERHGILYVEDTDQPPNTEAMTYLCEAVFANIEPSLLKEHPLYIVGNDGERHIRQSAWNHPDVRLVGRVPSLDPYFHQVRVCVVPLLHGAEINTPLIQSMMAGTPAVTTTIGAAGLGLTNQTHALIADTPAAFAAGITALLADAALWRHIADQAYAQSAAVHGRDAVFGRLLALVDAVIGGATANDLPSSPPSGTPDER